MAQQLVQPGLDLLRARRDLAHGGSSLPSLRCTTRTLATVSEVRAAWRRTDGSWREALTLDIGAGGLVARGTIHRGESQSPWLEYRMETDRDMLLTSATVTSSDGPRLSLVKDLSAWTDADTGAPLSGFHDCLDADLQATPFTNTLPIRRLRLRAHEGAQIAVLYIDADTLSLRRMEQRYTCVEPYPSGQGCYRYSSAGFEAELRVDEHGLVIDYPPFWTRVT